MGSVWGLFGKCFIIDIGSRLLCSAWLAAIGFNYKKWKTIKMRANGKGVEGGLGCASETNDNRADVNCADVLGGVDGQNNTNSANKRVAAAFSGVAAEYVAEFAAQFIAQFVVRLTAFLTRQARALNFSPKLADACHYAMMGGGKRLRPQLVVAAFLATGGKIDGKNSDRGSDGYDDNLGGQLAAEINHPSLWAAALAVELLHGYSLVHDDMPCLDDDALRRGRPTCHIVFGENIALLAGDALQALAFLALGDVPNKILAGDFLAIFAPRACRMVAGQTADVLGERQMLSEMQLRTIHADKTGALIEAAVLLGARAAADLPTEMYADLLQFAQKLGLAFQVQDDVLDVTASVQVLGKSAGSDEKLDKATYVKLLGVDGARAYADALFEDAAACAQRLPNPAPLVTLLGQVRVRNY